jgi:hypothetical protein
MSQLTLTPEEAVLALNAVRAKHAQTLSAYGFDDLELAALLARMEAHVAPVVVEEPAAVAAFMDDVPHEQVTHEEDQAPAEE